MKFTDLAQKNQIQRVEYKLYMYIYMHVFTVFERFVLI